MATIKTEKKGLIYEGFVKLALEEIKCGNIEWNITPKGVIAEQDLIIRQDQEIKAVFGVTFWGSHETAKMKVWRIHEDVFEVHQAYPKSRFGHVLFERNQASDANLADLVSEICGMTAVDDRNCKAIKILQQYVVSDSEISLFGSTRQSIESKCRELFKTDENFKDAILLLSKTISLQLSKTKKPEYLANVLNKAHRPELDERKFIFSGSRETFFKPALISLLDLGYSGVNQIFDIYDGKNLQDLWKVEVLKRDKLIELIGIARKVKISPVLNQIFQMGRKWSLEQLKLIKDALESTDNRLSSLLDHYMDLIQIDVVNKRLEILSNLVSDTELMELLINTDKDAKRRWALDYFMAIQREHTPAKKFGFQKLSDSIGVSYIGGISPVPRFAANIEGALTTNQILKLSKYMIEAIKKWNPKLISSEIIRRDRRTTLMKQLSVLDIVFLQNLVKRFPKLQIEEGVTIKHPLSSHISNKSAGSTKFNFKLKQNDSEILLFTVAAYEATHKHKEVSGRLRAALSTGEISESTFKIILADGNLLSGVDYTKRVQMMYEAGWNGVIFLDEIELLAEILE